MYVISDPHWQYSQGFYLFDGDWRKLTVHLSYISSIRFLHGLPMLPHTPYMFLQHIEEVPRGCQGKHHLNQAWSSNLLYTPLALA